MHGYNTIHFKKSTIIYIKDQIPKDVFYIITKGKAISYGTFSYNIEFNQGDILGLVNILLNEPYFFNVKENIYGDLFLNIVESRPTDTEGRYLRQSIIVYQEDIGEFIKEFQKSIDFIKINGTRRPRPTTMVRRRHADTSSKKED